MESKWSPSVATWAQTNSKGLAVCPLLCPPRPLPSCLVHGQSLSFLTCETEMTILPLGLL